MAKGAESKAAVTKKILETFAGSFTYNDGKEIRIPCQEAGETVQIKVTLTCAKENVEIITGAVVKAVNGDYYNVVGLPVARLKREIFTFIEK